METLKVGTKSNPNSVAGALANVMRDKGSVEIQAIGAGALNQAIKAIAIARGFGIEAVDADSDAEWYKKAFDANCCRGFI